MRVALLTVGTRGDIQPYIAIGDALRTRGHDVVISVSEDLVAFVEAAGLAAVAYEGVSIRAVFDAPENQRALASGKMLSFLATMKRENSKHQASLIAGFRKAMTGAELVITHPLVDLAACAIARHHGQKVMRTMLAPLVPTREFSSPFVELPVFKRLSHRLVWVWGWQVQKRAHREMCRELGIAPLADGYHTLEDARIPVAHLTSPALVPRPRDWPAHHVQTGACMLNPALRARLGEVGISAPLQAWLDEGAPPVFFGFGSMPILDPAAWLTLVSDVSKRLGVRALVGAGWTQHGVTGRLSKDLFIAQSLDHDSVFPLCRAAMHHGGLGTTTAALAAHLPALVSPVVADQPFVAGRVERIGAGVCVPFRVLTHDTLLRGLERVLALPRWAGSVETDGAARAAELAISAGV